MSGAADHDARRVILGRVNGLFGVGGWVKVYSFTSPPHNLLEYPVWQLRRHDQQWSRLQVVAGRRQGKTLVVLLGSDAGTPLPDRDAAASWVGADIAVYREQLPRLPADECYWADLVGLKACSLSGEALGEVTGLLETGAHDVLVIQGERERLVPFVRGHIVQSVDLAAGLIELDWDPDF